MKNFTIRRYERDDYSNWNAFVNNSKNATFLYHRDFMDYHSDRFTDYSLIILQEKKWIAIVPANIFENTIFSHQGLTYGGLVYEEKQKLATIIQVFQEILFFLHQKKIQKLNLKNIPIIYCSKPADELNYALFLAEAKLFRRDTLAVIDLCNGFLPSKDRKEGIKKGIKSALKIQEVAILDDFWNQILIPNLEQKHQAKPVHTLEEITKLKKMFPENIRQFNVYQNNQLVAGTTIFESKNVAHSQYISGNESKSDNGSLDFLHDYLLKNIFQNKKYFDFGTSNENEGTKLNFGLSYWKESFGASTIVQDFYEIETQNYFKLDDVLI